MQDSPPLPQNSYGNAGGRIIYTLQLSSKRFVSVRIILLLVTAIAVSRPVHAQKAPPDTSLAAAQLELVRAEIETEKTRMEYYRTQAEANGEKQAVPLVKKFLNDPADAVGAFGAVIGFFLAFFVLLGNRDANRTHTRDMEFYEALRRFGDGSPAMRAGASGILAAMGGVRNRRSRPYLDTAVDQLIAGHRLEENDAVRDAMTAALKQLILADPIRVRTRLSAAGIKLPDA